MERKTYMYKQGNGWVVSSWDESVRCYRLSHEMDYWHARTIVGQENCRHANDGKCEVQSHHHS